MATFSWLGTALKTASRKPVTTSSVMTTPSQKISPIASPKDSPKGPSTRVNDTIAFSPMPAAKARGKFATNPIRMVIKPPTRAVPAAIEAGVTFSAPPAPAAAIRMEGLTTRM